MGNHLKLRNNVVGVTLKIVPVLSRCQVRHPPRMTIEPLAKTES